MKWSIYNYPTQMRIPVEFDSYDEAKTYILHSPQQILIARGSTEEDNEYGWGEAWECMHALDPLKCIYCNPEFRDHFMDWCPRCCATTDSARTWHIPVAGDKALKAIAHHYVPVDDFAYFELRDLAYAALEGKAVQCLACKHPHIVNQDRETMT